MIKTSSTTELTFLLECFAIQEFVKEIKKIEVVRQARNRLYKAIFGNDFVICCKASRLLLFA